MMDGQISEPTDATIVDVAGDDAAPADALPEQQLDDQTPPSDPAPVPAYDPDDAEEARLFGWKSPDEWQGDRPAGYIDNPADYMARVRKSRIFRTMEERAESLAKGLEKVNKAAMERQRAAHEAELARIRRERDQAAEIGDMELYRDRARQEDDLRQKSPGADTEDKSQQGAMSDDDRAAIEAEKWLGNPALGMEAYQIVDYGLKTGALAQGTGARDQIAYAKRHLAQKYPHLFPAPEPVPAVPAKQHVDRVDGGGLLRGVAKQSAFDKLPAEAKSAFKRFVGEGLFKDTEEERKTYAEDYHAQ